MSADALTSQELEIGRCYRCGTNPIIGKCAGYLFCAEHFNPITAPTSKLDPTPDEDDWMLKQRLASPARYYGGNGTIHGTGNVNVEVDKNGKVVSVWFRCCMLPFDQTIVEQSRADEMNRAYANEKIPHLTGVEILDQE